MRYLCTVLILFTSFQLIGQSTVGLNFQGFLPSGELKKDAPEIGGGGLGLEGVFRIKESIFYLGGLLEFNNFGTKVREGYHGPQLGDVRVRRNFENIKVMTVFRFKPDFGPKFLPYLDLQLGAGNVYTRTTIRNSFFEQAFDAYYEIDKWAFMYGVGVGYEFVLSDALLLDLFIRSTNSARIEYLSPAGVNFDQGAGWYNLETRSSSFSHLNFGFGLKFYFTDLLEGIDELSN
jgi:opacity protein-like surface antigen